MNHHFEHQSTLRNSSQLPQRYRITWQKRLNLIALTLGSLLLVNTLFFARIAHATNTPGPTSAPTATDTPTPTNTPKFSRVPTSTPTPEYAAVPPSAQPVVYKGDIPAPLLSNPTLTLRDRWAMEWGFGLVSLLALVYWRGRPR